jgi:hypothetical protein
METESPGPNPGFGSKKGYLEESFCRKINLLFILFLVQLLSLK